MAITVRKGNWADFDPYKMRPAEFSIILDREQLYYCTSPGNVKRCATKEDVAEILETSEEAYDGLQQLLTELESETVLTGILNDISTLLDDVAINKSNIVTNTQNIVINTQDIVNLDDKVNTHLAEKVTQVGGAHGLVVASGTWTPKFGGDTTLGVANYEVQEGLYYRIGEMVYITGVLRITSASGGASYFTIQNLPYPPAGKNHIALAQTLVGNLGGALQIGNIADAYSGKIFLRGTDGTGAVPYQAIATRVDLYFSGWYRIN